MNRNIYRQYANFIANLKINYMSNEQIAEFLKEQILEVENSKKGELDRKIVTVHLATDVFLKMAHLFVGIHGK